MSRRIRYTEYKRWFPVSHDINRDPDMRELRKEHGDKAVFVWLELLSIADRNEGYVPGRLSLLSLTIGGLIGLKPISVANVIGWLSHRRKIVYHNGGGLDRSRYIANYAKYHRTALTTLSEHVGPNSQPPDLPDLPDLPKDKYSCAEESRPSGFSEFWERYPKKRSKGQAEKAWKTLNPSPDLQAKILRGIKLAQGGVEWQREGGQFIPYPATWLRAKGWEDDFSGNGVKKPLTLADIGKTDDERNEELARQYAKTGK